MAHGAVAAGGGEALDAAAGARGYRLLAKVPRLPPAVMERLVVHFDADVVDFNDAPLSEHTGRNTGISLATAIEALDVLLADERVVALSITEINPIHAAADDTALPRLIDGLARVLHGSRRTASPPAAEAH